MSTIRFDLFREACHRAGERRQGQPVSVIIRSERLDLVPFSPAFLRASLLGHLAEAEGLLGARLPRNWPLRPDLLGLRLGQMEADPALLPWLLRGLVLRDGGWLIGHIGFHTAPGPDYLRPFSPGAVEFGFTVFATFRRRGFAYEASVALMEWARTTHGVRRFVLSIRPDNLPSQGLAARLGFRKIGSHIDGVDGLEEMLERSLD